MKKNSLVRVLFIAFLLTLGVNLVYSQDNEKNNDKEKTTNLDSSEEDLKIEDSDNPEETGNKTNKFSSSEVNGNPSMGLFRLIIALVIVCALAYITLKFLKKSKVFKINDDPYLKIVATLKVDPSKTIYVVTVGSEAFLVGSTDKGMNSLGKIENTELIDAMNLNIEKSEPSSKQDFSNILGSFLPTLANKKKQQESENGFLSQQRNRLNKRESTEEKSNTEKKESEAKK